MRCPYCKEKIDPEDYEYDEEGRIICPYCGYEIEDACADEELQ